ncbi:MAG: 3-oxoadipate enol-lactonase [Gaiellaceae bacterium]|nr:3-oxoadipate enol-lactonase [Gaiellaceae bacterium]
MSVWHDVHGKGPAVVLVHAGIADSRMWEPQLRSFPESHTVVRFDLPGFGRSPIETNPVSYREAIGDALDAAGVARAAIVGTSLGGMTALEFALDAPERVSALVLVGAGIDDHNWSGDMEAFGVAEEAALERGDLEGAVTVNLDFWLAGPRRSLEEIDPEIRELVAEMQRDAFEQSKGHDDLRAARLDPPASQRLGDIAVPTLVLTGDEDVEDIRVIGDRLGREIPGAERASIAAAAHLPNLERPEEFDRIVLGFFGRHNV